MKRKRLQQLVALLMVLLLASGALTVTAADTEAADMPVIAKEDLKIGMILNVDTADGGWCQAHYQSILAAKEKLGLTDDQLIVTDGILEAGPDATNMIEQMIMEGCNVIFGTSSGYTNSIAGAAEQHPDVYFYQFEGKTGPNMTPYSIRDPEAIFVLGYVSALMSEVDELGFVAAQPQASVVRAINSFAAGAKYANPAATVQVVWANSWYDPAKEKEGATSLYESGIQALGYHGSTAAVAEAATINEGYCTGFHVDMHDYGPEAVLTSFMWNWEPIYTQILTSISEGTWNNETLFYGIDKGCASVSDFNADIIPEDVLEKAEEIKKQAMEGELVAFVGPLEDNEGNVLLEEGEEFTQDELINMMFLLDNVIGNLP